jgi:nondiscriminating glutamyl-tRNA synthetase
MALFNYEIKLPMLLATTIRVRFAPAPTGMMHLGNIRTALMNYLFAKQKGGTYILRVEDTDGDRNYDPNAVKIQEDLHWLGITHDEGPGLNEQYGPYLQSQRSHIYTAHLMRLIEKKLVYRCFCSTELLEKKRSRQVALGQPPRYDRTCMRMSETEISANLASDIPFIWRFKLDESKTVSINDIAHGTVLFELKNFSDFPLTRSDGSFTFIFANFIDDIAMKISHIFRGEEHITNTACQASLFEAFDTPPATYWHMPLLCNIEGKKLSKRDFGFSLRDLQKEGFLPEALINYLGIIGSSFAQEIMTKEELAAAVKFEGMHTASQIKYDVEKLRWINRKWIQLISPEQFYLRSIPFLEDAFGAKFESVAPDTVRLLTTSIQKDVTTLSEAASALSFYFDYQPFSETIIADLLQEEHSPEIVAVLKQLVPITDAKLFVDNLKLAATKNSIPLKIIYSFVRFCLTGAKMGPSVADIISLLGVGESNDRLKKLF